MLGEEKTKEILGKNGPEKVKVERAGHVMGLLLAKNMEATDKYNERVTKGIVVGCTCARTEAAARWC